MENQETIARLSYLRDKVERGDKLTIEEQKEAIQLVRQDRISASYASAASKSKKAAAPQANPAETVKKLQEMMAGFMQPKPAATVVKAPAPVFDFEDDEEEPEGEK